MSRRAWAAGDSDSEEEEQEQEQPLPPVEEQRSESFPVESSSGYDGILSGMMMNIRYSTTEEEIAQFLESNHCKVKHIELFYKEGEFAGRARIDFEDRASFDQFLSLHDKPFNEKSLITKPYEERTPTARGGRFGGSTGRGGRGERREDRRDINKASSRDSRDGGRFGDFRKNNSREDRFDGRPNREERFDARPNREERFDARPKRSTEKDTKPIAKIPEEPEGPKERPRVVLQPRTLPIEIIGKTNKTSDIFGGGKPHDEFQYEEKKKFVHVEKKPESESIKDFVDELKVEKILLKDESKPVVEAPQPVKKEEEVIASTTTEPPKPPTTEEEEDNGNKGKYKSRSSGGRHNNERRYNNDRNDRTNQNPRSFNKNKAKDEDRQSEVVPDSSEPAGEKSQIPAEETEQTNDQGERKDRRSYRKGKNDRFSERSDDREVNGERKPFTKKNDYKGKKEKPVAASTPTESQEEKKKLEVEVKPEPTKDEEGFEVLTKIKKAKPVAKPVAAPLLSTKSTSSATTPKSGPAVKNAFAGLDSDSD